MFLTCRKKFLTVRKKKGLFSYPFNRQSGPRFLKNVHRLAPAKGRVVRRKIRNLSLKTESTMELGEKNKHK
jgi:hypothetical protein